jgi:hypothetical protein
MDNTQQPDDAKDETTKAPEGGASEVEGDPNPADGSGQE